MREAFEAEVEVNGGGFAVLVFDEAAGFGKAFILQPLAGCHGKRFLKVALKAGQAAPGKLRKLFDRQVKMKIAQHKLFEVNFMRFRKVEQKVAQGRHGQQ